MIEHRTITNLDEYTNLIFKTLRLKYSKKSLGSLNHAKTGLVIAIFTN
jgi:hypothetical protein